MLFLDLYFNHKRVSLEEITGKSCYIPVEREHLHDFHKATPYGILISNEDIHIEQNLETVHKKYMGNPPERMTSKDIHHMNRDDLLDMDYFLNKDKLFDDKAGMESFISSKLCHLSAIP